MAKKKAASPDDSQYWIVQHITIEEPSAGKFKITPGKGSGILWECFPRRQATVEQAKRDYLRSINKTAAQYLTQEQVDDFFKVIEDAGFRIKMPPTEWKKAFARRFHRLLESKGITLEQLEQQPQFSDPSAKRWLRNLYKNGGCRFVGVATMWHFQLCQLLGVTSID